MKKSQADNFDNPKIILLFNRLKILAAVFASYNECERITGIPHSLIQRVCSGKRIQTKGFYFRELKEDIDMESSDLGKLTLLEYDRDILHEDRKVFANGTPNSKTILESQLKSLNQF